MSKEVFGSPIVSNSFFKIIVILQILSCKSQKEYVNNQTIIKIINDMKTTWTAGENQMVIPDDFFDQEPDTSPMGTLDARPVRTPDTFDAREHWSQCKSVMNRIRTQGKCLSCWAVTAASVISDRICIETNATRRVHISAEDITTCCRFCSGYRRSCSTGRATNAMYYWIRHGIVTGGEVNSTEGCKPYSQRSFNKQHSPCRRICTNEKHYKPYGEDLHRGRIVYYVRGNEQAMKTEIFTHGPVAGSITYFEDLLQYENGVYVHKTGILKGSHAIKILGWGEESGKKYWLCANSWGTGWGLMGGFFKIVRGRNHLGVERQVGAARMSNILGAGETLREAAASGANKRRRLFAQEHFIYVFCIWSLIR